MIKRISIVTKINVFNLSKNLLPSIGKKPSPSPTRKPNGLAAPDKNQI